VTVGCAYFTYWWLDGTCVLQGIGATWSSASDAVSGPPVCVAHVETHVAGVDFNALTQAQVETLSSRLAAALATSAGLNDGSVEDLNGDSKRVSLSAGSLVAGGHLSLPPGKSVGDVSSSVSTEEAFQRVEQELVQAGVGRPEDFERGTSVMVTVGSGCFLAATRFAADPEQGSSEADDEESAVQAQSAAQCQARCQDSATCKYFSFRRAEGEGLGECSLLQGPVVPVRDEGGSAGPRTCPPLPPSARGLIPGSAEGIQDGANAGDVWGFAGQAARDLASGDTWTLATWGVCSALLLGTCLAVGIFAGGKRRRRRDRLDDDDHKYAPLSRQEDVEDGGDTESGSEGHDVPSHSSGAQDRRGLPEPIPQTRPSDYELRDAIFNSLDRNGDGYITREEFAQGFGGPARGIYA